MRRFIHIAFFIFFPPLLAGPLPEDDFESFYGPSSLSQVSSPDADVLASNPAVDDMEWAATGAPATYLASGEPSLFSSDVSSMDPDQPFLESSCDTADRLGFSKLRRQDGGFCLKKGETPITTIPITIPVKPLSPGTGTDPNPNPVPEIFLELNMGDGCSEPYIHPLCCEWGPAFDAEAASAFNIAVYEKLVGCYISIMTLPFPPRNIANQITSFFQSAMHNHL